jgi:hypothetical protein
MKFPGMNEADIENINAVIAAYESGALDLNKRKGQRDVAFFWGGVLQRGWGPMGKTMEVGPPMWQKENPSGKLFVENVSIRMDELCKCHPLLTCNPNFA